MNVGDCECEACQGRHRRTAPAGKRVEVALAASPRVTTRALTPDKIQQFADMARWFGVALVVLAFDV